MACWTANAHKTLSKAAPGNAQGKCKYAGIWLDRVGCGILKRQKSVSKPHVATRKGEGIPITNRTGDSLRDLAHSTLAFFKRFGVEPTVRDSTQNFREEVEELIEAAQEGTDKDHIAEEAADVMVTAIGLAHAAGVDTEKLILQVYAVIAKNDGKTHETHVHVDGKIRRRAKLT